MCLVLLLAESYERDASIEPMFGSWWRYGLKSILTFWPWPKNRFFFQNGFGLWGSVFPYLTVQHWVCKLEFFCIQCLHMVRGCEPAGCSCIVRQQSCCVLELFGRVVFCSTLLITSSTQYRWTYDRYLLFVCESSDCSGHTIVCLWFYSTELGFQP